MPQFDQDALRGYLQRASEGKRFSSAEKEDIIALLEDLAFAIESRKSPEKFRLASGELAKGATGRIALNAYAVLLGRKVHGRDYARVDDRLGRWAKNLAFHIMRANFTHGHPRGVYCCGTCTLSVLPLYAVDAFPWFDCRSCARNVVDALANRQSVFSRRVSAKYGDWATRFVA